MKLIVSLFVFLISLNAMEVKICSDPDWMPLEGIDKNGGYDGISSDILKLIEKNNDISFKLVITTSWSESQEFVKQGKCDILPLAAKTKDRLKYLKFPSAYLQYPRVLVVKISQSSKKLDEIIKLPLGFIKGYSAIKVFKKQYPSINIIEVENIDDGFDKVRNNVIYGFVGALPIVGYKLKKDGTIDLKISFKFDSYVSIGMAIRKGNDTLYSELIKAINDLKEDEIQDILFKWIKIDIDDIIDYSLIYQVLSLIILLIFFILYWNYRLNKIVKEKTKELVEFADTLKSKVEEKTKELKDKNKKLEDSIKYAQRIQISILPDTDTIKNTFNDYFIIWNPLDVISGDLYIYEKKDNGIYIGVLDCTGHGVPGGLMTMLVGGAIKRLIASSLNTSEILENLNKIIKEQLKQHKLSHNGLSDDGLDIGLCFFDFESNVLSFSGAKINLLSFDEKKNCSIIVGDNINVGYTRVDDNQKFKMSKIPLENNCTFYLTTDGLITQTGGKNSFSYSKKRLISLLSNIQDESLEKQKQLIMENVRLYQGDDNTKDDITMIGFKYEK